MDKGKKSCTSHKGKKETFFSLMKPLSISRQRQEKKRKENSEKNSKANSANYNFWSLIHVKSQVYKDIFAKKKNIQHL